MKKLNYFAILGVSTIFTMSSCKKNKGCEDGFFGLDRIAQDAIIETPQSINSLEEGLDCRTVTYKWAPAVEDFLLLNPNDAIYPGAILGASSLVDGGYASIGGERAPLKLSVDIQGLANSYVEVPSGNLSDVRTGLSELLSQEITGNLTARIESSKQFVYSANQMKASVGVKVGGSWGDVAASFDFSNTEKSSKYLVKFKQVYYTVNIDRPNDPADFWTSCPKEELFKGDVPVYVSEVKYGRMVLFMIESSLSETQVRAAVDASFGIGLTDVDINSTYLNDQFWESSNVSVKVVGGNATDAVRINSKETLETFINNGAQFSSSSRGEPIAYTLRFLDDNSVARVITTTEYTVRECTVLEENEKTITPAPINDVNCALLTDGDEDIGDGESVNFDFSSELVISSDGREILARINFNIGEVDNGTRASVTFLKSVFTAPNGAQILSIHQDDKNVTLAGRIVGSGTQIIDFNQLSTPAGSPVSISGSTGSSVSSIKILTNPSGTNDVREYMSQACSASEYANISNITFNSIRYVLLE